MAIRKAAAKRTRPPAGAGRVTPKLKIWVAFASGAKFGHGRADLLESIDRLGSIQRAVQEIGMSYRYAWGYLRELEAAAGFKLLERPTGRGPAGGTRLSAEGRKFLERYRRFETAMAAEAERRFCRIFPPAGVEVRR
jgi:molybdate transport system regulatory protein